MESPFSMIFFRLGSFRNSFSDRWNRRALRNALQSRDSAKIKAVIARGQDVNATMSDAFSDTPLIFAVRKGYLDIVEVLLQLPGTKVDQLHRNQHSALDEALHIFLTSSHSNKQVAASMYRIIKCLLSSDAMALNFSYLDASIFSVINSKAGQARLQRMVKVSGSHGSVQVKSSILGVLIQYHGLSSQIKFLLSKGANPCYFIDKMATVHNFPLQNAIVVVEYGSSNIRLLHLVHHCTVFRLSKISREWSKYRILFHHLVQLGMKLQLSVMAYLFANHPSFYKWVVHYESQPKSLLYLCRNRVRRQMNGSIIYCVDHIPMFPDSLKEILVLH